MIIVSIILFSLVIASLPIAAGLTKTDEERRIEDEEQIKWLHEYRKKKR